MDTESVRIVNRDSLPGIWAIRQARGGDSQGAFAEKELAVAAALSELRRSVTGGRLQVFDEFGLLEHDGWIDHEEPVAVPMVFPPVPARQTVGPTEDFWAGLSGARGVVKKADTSYKWLFWALALLPVNAIATAVTPAVTEHGTSVFGVFLGTLALAGAVFLVTVVLRLNDKLDLQSLLILAAVALIASIILAYNLGQTVPNLDYVFEQMHGSNLAWAAVQFIGLSFPVFLGLYGWLGVLLSLGSGVILGWQTARVLAAVR